MADLSLDNIVTNNMNFKHLETTKDIIISIKNESGFPQRPDATHTWTAKVSDGTNYVGDYAVKINQNSLIVDSEDFTKLPTGSYQLEVWEEWTDQDGTKQRSIYPSPSQTIPFTIYANITDQAEKEIKSIGFQDVVDQAVMNVGMNYVLKVNMIDPNQTATVVQSAADGKNYVTFNIPQGPKGDQGNVGPAPTFKIGTVTKLNSDQTPTANLSGGNGSYTLDMGIPQGSTGATGTVDNAGLTNAPAFQALQTRVNDSAVGTNLLTNTSDFSSNWYGMPSISTTVKYNGHPIMVFTSSTQQLANQNFGLGILQNSTQYVASFWAKADNAGDKAHTELWGSNGATDFVLTTNWTRYAAVLTSYSDANTNNLHSAAYFGTTNGNTGNIYIALPKLEKGSVATPWCPNPSEILTQSDYAKIKAAIVALGGSLS